MGDWVSLHHHSSYSYLDGYGMPEEHAKAAADLGMPAFALTEHGNVSSHVPHERACKAAGIKPIFGVELYTGAVDAETRSRYKWHLTVLAENQVGYSNLLRLVSRGWAEGFYFEPTVSGSMLAEHSEGLIVLSGCSGSKMACDLLGGKGVEPHDADIRAARDTAQRFKDLLGDRFYLEAQAFPELERTQAINQAWERVSDELGIPLVITGDVHYPKPDDSRMQAVLHAIDRGGKGKHVTVEAMERSWGYDVKLTAFADEVIYEKAIASGLSPRMARAAIAATADISSRCNVEIPKLKDLVYPTDDDNSEGLFRAWMNRGWKYRGFDKLPLATRQEYIERVRYEMNLIIDKGFVDYFLVISDLVRYAKNNGIPVGPARGSAAASLVCYLLRITEVNPMFFPNLLFERFIDINRHDLPDIDLDFDDDERWRIRAYLVDKYGEDRVGNIGTFTKFKGKNSLDDTGRVFNIPLGAVTQVKELLIERASGDLRGNATIEDTIEMFPKAAEVFEKYPDLYTAKRLEGNLRGFSVHAAGLVVANEPLTKTCAVYTRIDKKTGMESNVISLDKHDAEYLNVLKIDVLGLKTMGLIRLALEMIGMSLEELYAVPLDDEKVYESFRAGDVIGVFQFDGRAMRSVNREVKPDTFAEVCDINALARPGPLHSGAAAEYIQVKHGRKEAESLHPVVDEITAHTNRQIVYQEQILQVVRRLGNFSWEQAALIRKLISKKQGEQAFNRMQQIFLEGCAENGVGEQNALKIWKQLVTAGAYAFNAAHCVSYGMLAYWTMWLKVHHPQAFYVAALRKYDNDKDKIFDILKEAKKKDIEILPPDPMKSDVSWTPEGDAIRAGLTQIKGIGAKTAEAMLEYRRESWDVEGVMNPVLNWSDYIAVRGIGPKTMEMVEEFCEQEDPFGLDVLGNKLAMVREMIMNGELDTRRKTVYRPTHTSEDVPYEAKFENVVWIGVIKERNLKDLYELHRSRTGEELDPATVKEPDHINWVVMTGEDETGPLVITVHRYGGQYDRYKDIIWDIRPNHDIVVVKGVKRMEYRRAIYAKDLIVIDPDD